jgi:hypothetical protein
MTEQKKIQSFKEFWPFYLNEHRKKSTKLVHFCGTTLGIALFFLMLWTEEWWLLPAGLVLVYALLFSSHFIFEKNRPATLTYPFWSFFADFKMWYGILCGKIKL